jgi:hypothetical protein
MWGTLPAERMESVIYSYSCFFALPEQSLLGSSPTKLTIIFYYFIWDSHNLKGKVLVFISTMNKVAQLYPRALAGLQWRYSNSPPQGAEVISQISQP